MKLGFKFLGVIASILWFAPLTASAAEITVWTARAIATVLAEVGPEFERSTGHKLTISSDLSSAFARRVEAGEPFDLLISGSSSIDAWIKDGKIIAETRTDIARSGIGLSHGRWLWHLVGQHWLDRPRIDFTPCVTPPSDRPSRRDGRGAGRR